jgi:hypothetical protein
LVEHITFEQDICVKETIQHHLAPLKLVGTSTFI